MAQQFRVLGWTDVRTDLRGNVIARRPSGAHDAARPAVWCCAHLDTVFTDPAPQVTRDGAALRGPGIGDNGRGLAALLALADALHGTGLTTPHEIILACTVGEEGLGDLRGMKQLMDDATPAPHAVIAIDGAGDDRIVTTALGSLRWRISFAASGGHSWADFGAPNPVHAAAAVAAALQALTLPREPRTTLTVARIGGGETINSIPRDGWLEVDMRSLSAGVLADLDRTLRETVARVERTENGRRLPGSAPLTSEVTLLGSRPCGALREDAPLVRLAQQATRAVGITPRLATGSTDASVPIARGIPAIAIGAGGRGGGTHTPEEWYDDTNGVRGLERALRIVVAAAGLQ
jgi:acetylornithine deacetylase/succinyl-diaminopimelate desuccinylase-like protein